MSVDELKAKGNSEFSAGKYQDAIKTFSEAITLDANNHVLYSNRSGAYAALNDYENAKKDAESCIAKKADWFKGYSRLGAALHGLRKFDDAITQYEKAKNMAPEANKATVQTSLDDVIRDKLHESKQQAANPFAKIFGPDALAKIASNPKLQPLLAKPGFVQKIQNIQQNPSLIQGMIQDPDIMTCFVELAGLQGQFNKDGADGEDESEDAARRPPPEMSEEEKKKAAEIAEMRRQAALRREREEHDAELARKREAEQKAAEEKKKAEDAKKSAPAEAAKAEGNKFYLARKFDEALAKYDEAFQLDPKNTVYLLNRTAVLFEQAKYEEVIEECDKAMEHAREHKTDYQVVAKIMTRKATALHKQNKHEDAITLYRQALLEHRNADTLNKLNACEAEKKKLDAEAYINPELSLKAKDDGNAAYKAGDFPEAVKCYTEAIKRNPKDHIPYSNRAGAYIKLMAFDDAVRDCDKCIELNPTFARAYARKGTAYMLTKQYHRALKAYEEGLQHDPEHGECKEGRIKCMYKIQEVSQSGGDEDVAQRAMQDPEIQGILNDSYMQMVLGEVQKNPARLNDYMKDSRIASNINKLIAAGVIRTGPGPAPGAGRR